MFGKSNKTQPGTVALGDFVAETINEIYRAREKSPNILGVRGVINFEVSAIVQGNDEANIKVGILGGVAGLGAGVKSQVSAQNLQKISFSIQTRGAISPNEKNTK